jgi:hypothetical protein
MIMSETERGRRHVPHPLVEQRVGTQWVQVGVSPRQLEEAVRPFGYTVACVRVRGCLHLKSAATALRSDSASASR